MQAAKSDIRIVPLADVTDTIAELADLLVAEWEPYYGPRGPGNAVDDLRARCNRNELPIALVALDIDNKPLGTAALKQDSVGSKPGQAPWLAALVVNPLHRGNGIGTLLVAAIETEAIRLGFTTLYISTNAADRIVQKRGWLPLDTVTSLRGPITVYRCDLHET
ncbi:MAG: GNAT family N-acetyltransferase [Alphaproteobacteria bacterium]|nr:GNAT family N-acetyltransferase [Alphaproteobacteria bacterium]